MTFAHSRLFRNWLSHFFFRDDRFSNAHGNRIFDQFTDPAGGDHFHAPGHASGRYVFTECLGLVQWRTVSQRNGPGFPAAAGGAAIELADGMQVMMTVILFPVGGLTPTRDDDAMAQALATFRQRHG